MDREESENLQLKKAMSYANGYRELGMFDDALEELSRLPDSLIDRIEVSQMKLAIFVEAKDWTAAACAAKNLSLREPADPGHFVNLAFATRRAQSIEEAKAILDDAALRFPNVAIIHYNLGCYACQEADLEGAKEKLVAAFSMDPSFLDTAKGDEDLDMLTDWLDNLEIA